MSNEEQTEGDVRPQPLKEFQMPEYKDIISRLNTAGLLTNPEYGNFYTTLGTSYSRMSLTGETLARRWDSAAIISFPNRDEARHVLDDAFIRAIRVLVGDEQIVRDAEDAYAKIIESRREKK